MAQRFDKIVELRKQRKKEWEDARKFREERESQNEDGKLNAEEQRSFNERLNHVEELTEQIEAAERELAVEEKMLEAEAKKREETEREPNQDGYRSAFESYLRRGMNGLSAEERSALMENMQTVEQRALAAGTDASGGYTVPEEMWQGIVDAQKQFNALRRTRAEIMRTSDGRDMPIPTSNDTANSGELLSENTQATEQDIAFGSKNLVAYMFSSKIIRVSLQFLQDSGIDVEAFLQAKLAERIGRSTANYFTTGSGTGQPEGSITGAAVGHTAASSSAITYDEILDLVHSVDPAYRMNAEFQFSDTILKALKQLKDAENRPIWLPGTQLREPDTVNGFPYTVNQNMAGFGVDNKVVSFGDFSHYKIRDVRGGMVLRLTERYADYAQVGFIGFFRHGGILADAGTNPIKVLQLAAA